MKRHALMTLGLGLWLGGCSTIVHGPLQEVRIDSNPPGATATISAVDSQRGPGYFDEKQAVTTPAVVKLRRDNNYRIEFEKAGFASSRAELVSHYDWFWGGISCGPCEAVADLPDVDTTERSWPVRFLTAAFYEYPKGFIGGWGKGLRVFSPDALLGNSFNLKPKDAGFWDDFHALGSPQVTATLTSK